LLRPEEGKQMAVISNLFVATTERTMIEILQHPLLEIYLQLKWSKVVYLFYVWIALHIISVICMTTYVCLLSYTEQDNDEAATILCYIMFAFGLIHCIYGIIQVNVLTLRIKTKYLLQFLVLRPFRIKRYEMWINFITTILVLIVVSMGTVSKYGAKFQNMAEWVLYVISAAILLLWIEFMMLIARIPKYGYYAVMFGVVLKNVIKVLCRQQLQ
jgi:hypothetical protein